MSHIELGTTYVYLIRNTKSQRVYRSRRNPKFVLKVETLNQSH